jgi:hypothetical protein
MTEKNLWGDLAEASGWDRAAAKAEIYKITAAAPLTLRSLNAAQEELYLDFLQLIEARPAYLSSLLGMGDKK